MFTLLLFFTRLKPPPPPPPLQRRDKVQERERVNSFRKVLTNEKRDGLAVVSFDRSRFNLYSRKFFKQIGAGPIL
jgi:hypothetical protein